ncbi:MAG: hypothetical protein D6694_12790 [Gammaproteobacteria bacterium]|nr:MAG: hypothetical protein D6694_12790 [Gammaproteobacteria bacterium]
MAIQPKNDTAIKVDTITEKTASNGVSIEGVILKDSAINYGGTSSGSANAQAITSPAISAYTAGMMISFISGFTNTGSTTLNVNSLGAKTIKDQLGNTLRAGMLQANTPYVVIYDGTDFILPVRGGRQIKQISQSADGSLRTTSSTTFTAMNASISLSPVSGDYVKLTANLSCSAPNLGDTITFTFYEAGSAVGTSRIIEVPSAGNNGREFTVSFSELLTSPTVGTNTYDVYWKSDNGVLVSSRWIDVTGEVLG